MDDGSMAASSPYVIAARSHEGEFKAGAWVCFFPLGLAGGLDFSGGDGNTKVHPQLRLNEAV